MGSTEDCAAWKPEVSAILRTAGLPLPSWCTTGPYPLLSDAILPLLSELSELPNSFYADSCNATQHRLEDVLNLTLSTVLDIRSLIAHYGPSRSALPFVSSLIRVLAHMCAKEAIIMYLLYSPNNPSPAHVPFTGQMRNSCGRGLQHLIMGNLTEPRPCLHAILWKVRNQIP